MPPRRPTKVGTPHARTTKTQRDARVPTDGHNEEAIRRFLLNIFSIHACFDEIHQVWAKLVGLSEAQWLILLAIDELDTGEGVPGIKICAKLHIHPTFVTTQTKGLEKAGFVTRIASPTDARFVLMSLTDKARAEIAKLSERRRALNESIFAGLDDPTLQEITERLTEIMKNAERAARVLSAEN